MNASLLKPDHRPARLRGHSREAATTRHAPLALWRVAEAFMRTLFVLFGAPEDVARRHTLTAKPYRLLLSWLSAGEAMMRRLLLIEASAFPKPNTRPLLHPRRRRARKLMGLDAEHPEKWRVSFRCFTTADRRLPAGKPALQHAQGCDASNTVCRLEAGGPRRRTPREERWQTHAKPVTFHSAWPAAERYEALLRVFNDPIAYARRLAKRLHATLHRVVELLRAPPGAEHRVERFAELTEAARARWRIPNTS